MPKYYVTMVVATKYLIEADNSEDAVDYCMEGEVIEENVSSWSYEEAPEDA